MKRFLLSALFSSLMLISSSVLGQDLIVTTSGDSLNCKIHNERSGFVQFTYINPTSNKPTKTVISSTKIAAMIRNYFKPEELPSEMKQIADYQKIRLHANAGYSYKLGISSASDPDDIVYEKDIRNGARFGGGLDVFFNERNGIGFKFSRFRSRANLDVEVMFDDNPDSTETFAAQEKLVIAQYSVLWRRRWNSSKHDNSFNLGLGLGVVTYRDNLTLLSETIYEEAFALALDLELSYDVALSKSFALTFGADLGTGYFENSTVNFPDGTSETFNYGQGEGVSAGRVSVWLGLTFKN